MISICLIWYLDIGNQTSKTTRFNIVFPRVLYVMQGKINKYTLVYGVKRKTTLDHTEHKPKL